MIWYNIISIAFSMVKTTYSTLQKKWERTSPKFGEIREFRRTNCEISFQTKIRRNFGVSIVLVPVKFRKLVDEPKRKFAAWTEISLRNFEKAPRNFASVTKFRFVLNDISVRRAEISCERNEISLLKSS